MIDIENYGELQLKQASWVWHAWRKRMETYGHLEQQKMYIQISNFLV